jgi:crotonobetaine/carnitine-CoA ligase
MSELQFDTIPALLRRRARERPQQRSIAMDGRWLTYGELDGNSRLVAGFLKEAGYDFGDRIGLFLENCPEFLFCWFGINRLGAIQVPLNTELRAQQLRYCLENCGMHILIVGATLLDRLSEIELPPAIERLIVIGDTGPGKLPSFPGVSSEPFEAIARLGRSEDGEDVELTAATPAVIIYTSGTTGPSKGVVCSHGYFTSLAADTMEVLGVGSRDVLYDAHPLYHAQAQGQGVMGALSSDIPLVMRKKFSASGFLKDVVEYGVTTAFLIGAAGLMLKQPLSALDRNHSLRVICAVPVPKDQLHALEQRFGVPAIDLYGMTELGAASANPLSRRVPNSCGVPLPSREIRIVDELDRPLPARRIGQIVVRSKRPWSTFLEYWGMPDKTAESLRNMWFHTGDAGYFDEDGYLYFIGRIKDAIRRRGENISAFEVEQAINGHPAVLETAILPYPSPVGEDDVWAVVIAVPGEKIEPVELISYCETVLQRYAVPRYITFADVLPKTPTGRIEKYKLVALGLPPGTYDRESATGSHPREN